ncbi:MAG: adenylate/guanylate cyclase domain-containing protein [Gallionella sp.]|nr:adenylate/guanylate cyclase domain-containing protein [Gallionella sp.]MDD4960402.1 adenylate/guanylate cyclase domain-containing protein [Gallionella sp.]
MIQVLIIDSNPYTRTLLVERLTSMAHCVVQAYESSTQLKVSALPTAHTVVVLNHHTRNDSPAEFLTQLKAHSPQYYIVVITSPGVQKRSMVALREAEKIDSIFEKPIDLEVLAQRIDKQVESFREIQQLTTDHLNLLRFLPTGALRRIFLDLTPGQAEVFDMVVMFTDIRNSSRWIMETSARDYFAKLHTLLGEQARLIRLYDGMVIKTTGDGLLAVFAGSARCHLALKCALAIQRAAQSETLPVGVGITDGLMLAGILGTQDHLHIDVIGVQVHLAARLCNKAQAGEILAAQSVIEKGHIRFANAPLAEAISVRGFDTPVNCTRIPPQF